MDKEVAVKVTIRPLILELQNKNRIIMNSGFKADSKLSKEKLFPKWLLFLLNIKWRKLDQLLFVFCKAVYSSNIKIAEI